MRNRKIRYVKSERKTPYYFGGEQAQGSNTTNANPFETFPVSFKRLRIVIIDALIVISTMNFNIHSSTIKSIIMTGGGGGD